MDHRSLINCTSVFNNVKFYSSPPAPEIVLVAGIPEAKIQN